MNANVLKNPAVVQLERQKAYTDMAKMSVQTRINANKAVRFKDMRSVIRSAAKKARQAYVDAEKAEPETPHVTDFLQVITPGNFIR